MTHAPLRCVVETTALAGLLCFAAAATTVGQTNDIDGEWVAYYDWEATMVGAAQPPPGTHSFAEIGHAALLPVGVDQGKILLWNFNIQTQTTHTFLFDPMATPGNELEVLAPVVPSNIFCGGHAFLPDGTLLVAGGHPPDGGAERAFRYLTRTRTWTELAPMVDQRFYPTLTLLSRTPLATSGGAWTTQGSSVLVIGGPPSTHTNQGQPRFEVLPGPLGTWKPVVPSPLPLPPPPSFATCVSFSGHQYTVVPPLGSASTHGCDDVKFDSYPRALALTSGDLFVAGDVETIWHGTVAHGASPKGRTWFVRPPGVGEADEWEVHEGPWMEGGPAGFGKHRRFYSSAVVLHQLAHKSCAHVRGRHGGQIPAGPGLGGVASVRRGRGTRSDTRRCAAHRAMAPQSQSR